MHIQAQTSGRLRTTRKRRANNARTTRTANVAAAAAASTGRCAVRSATRLSAQQACAHEDLLPRAAHRVEDAAVRKVGAQRRELDGYRARQPDGAAQHAIVHNEPRAARDKHAIYRMRHVTGKRQRAACTRQEATSRRPRTTCNMQPACNMQHVPCAMHHEPAIYGMQRTTRNMHHATRHRHRASRAISKECTIGYSMRAHGG